MEPGAAATVAHARGHRPGVMVTIPLAIPVTLRAQRPDGADA
jgi:hypothetical protein